MRSMFLFCSSLFMLGFAQQAKGACCSQERMPLIDQELRPTVPFPLDGMEVYEMSIDYDVNKEYSWPKVRGFWTAFIGLIPQQGPPIVQWCPDWPKDYVRVPLMDENSGHSMILILEGMRETPCGQMGMGCLGLCDGEYPTTLKFNYKSESNWDWPRGHIYKGGLLLKAEDIDNPSMNRYILVLITVQT